MAMIGYLWYYKPFDDPMQGKMWILSEVWLMVSTGMLFLFTDHTPPRVRYNYGFAYMSLYTLCFAVNIVHLSLQKCSKKSQPTV